MIKKPYKKKYLLFSFLLLAALVVNEILMNSKIFQDMTYIFLFAAQYILVNALSCVVFFGLFDREHRPKNVTICIPAVLYGGIHSVWAFHQTLFFITEGYSLEGFLFLEFTRCILISWLVFGAFMFVLNIAAACGKARREN